MKTNELDQRIEKVRKRVEESKAAYDRVSKELKNLMDKKKLMQAEEIMNAITKSGKSYEEAFNQLPLELWGYKATIIDFLTILLCIISKIVFKICNV